MHRHLYRSFEGFTDAIMYVRVYIDGIGKLTDTSVKVATLTVHLRLKPGGSLERTSRVDGHKGELAASVTAVLPKLEWIGFVFGTFTVNAHPAPVRFVPE